jgi:hypothetical protein
VDKDFGRRLTVTAKLPTWCPGVHNVCEVVFNLWTSGLGGLPAEERRSRDVAHHGIVPTSIRDAGLWANFHEQAIDTKVGFVDGRTELHPLDCQDSKREEQRAGNVVRHLLPRLTALGVEKGHRGGPKTNHLANPKHLQVWLMSLG